MNKLLHSQSVVVTLLIALSSFAHAITERLFNSVNAHLVDTRLDPLVNPNSCSSHVHSVFGSVNFASTVTRNDLHDPEWQDDTDKAEQTTSHIIPNRSMYWAPSLYIFNPEDELYYIVPSFSRTYYRIEHRGEVSGINPIPMFLQLIAGNARRTKEWLPTANHDDIRWTVRSNRQETNSMEHGDWGYLRRDPQIVADEDQLEMNVIFPNCLQVHDDGTPVISSADYRSHASYAYRNRCPESFPYHIPTVNLEVRYDLEAMRQLLGRDVVNNIDNWYLSTRDSSGAGAHADFVSAFESDTSGEGWPEDLMENAILHCRRNKAKDNDGNCLVEKYFDQNLGRASQRHVEFTHEVPDEAISPVRRIPRGPCPDFV